MIMCVDIGENGTIISYRFSVITIKLRLIRKSGQQHLLFGAIHNSCKPSVKHRYSCFTTLSGGRCPPHSPPAREITSPLTPECRLRRFFIIYLKVNAVALNFIFLHIDKHRDMYYNIALIIKPKGGTL